MQLLRLWRFTLKSYDRFWLGTTKVVRLKIMSLLMKRSCFNQQFHVMILISIYLFGHMPEYLKAKTDGLGCIGDIANALLALMRRTVVIPLLWCKITTTNKPPEDESRAGKVGDRGTFSFLLNHPQCIQTAQVTERWDMKDYHSGKELSMRMRLTYHMVD